jgi:hypothetical protein
MALRTGHGTGAGELRIEVLPAVERRATNADATARISRTFSLAPGGPAMGYGQFRSYLPAQAVDVGACSRAFTTCR